MSRILLADDSPHAQRMGERILREEGYEVVTVTDGQTALMRLADVDPDLVFADVSLPTKTGYEICREIKSRQRHLPDAGGVQANGCARVHERASDPGQAAVLDHTVAVARHYDAQAVG